MCDLTFRVRQSFNENRQNIGRGKNTGFNLGPVYTMTLRQHFVGILISLYKVRRATGHAVIENYKTEFMNLLTYSPIATPS